MVARKSDCPSSNASNTNKIIGIKMGGKVHLLPQALPVSSEFLSTANEQGEALSDFRFTGKCIENSCKQWNGTQCGIINHLLNTIEKSVSNIPNCSIRNTCRWHQQEGFDACRVCEQVTYFT